MDLTILEDLGLTNAEIKVYIALLEIGSSSAGFIVEKSKLQNSVVHRALNSLIEKGLISYIQESKRKIYSATSPDTFYEIIENKKKRFNQLFPLLKRKHKESNVKESTHIFRGKKGLIEMYRLLLNAKSKEYNTFGGGSDVTYEVMGETWWKNFHTKRISKKLKSRQIFDESIVSFGKALNRRSFTNIRFLPKEYSQLQETVIVGSFVGIAIFTENPYGVLIKDKIVAESYRKKFELIWKIAKVL